VQLEPYILPSGRGNQVDQPMQVFSVTSLSSTSRRNRINVLIRDGVSLNRSSPDFFLHIDMLLVESFPGFLAPGATQNLHLHLEIVSPPLSL